MSLLTVCRAGVSVISQFFFSFILIRGGHPCVRTAWWWRNAWKDAVHVPEAQRRPANGGANLSLREDL